MALETEWKEQVDWSDHQEVSTTVKIVLIKSVLVLSYKLSKFLDWEVDIRTEDDQ